MKLWDFDFALPEDRIALRPARPRDAARLLVRERNGALLDAQVLDLPRFLRAGDLLVFNDTRTIPAALKAHRPPRNAQGAGVSADVNLHQQIGPDQWRAFARPAKRLAPGETLMFAGDLRATIEERSTDGELRLRFSHTGDALNAAILTAGSMPLPPYIARKRQVDIEDSIDYQTVYAREAGSVATPTAGLHFTASLLESLRAGGVDQAWLTLHVGAGTFLPVKVENIEDHKMHAETYSMSEETAAKINAAKAEGRRVIAVGTTSLRTLESAANADGLVCAGSASTSIFITPGYRFKVVDGLMTNFHLPKSTLLMLVSAFVGFEAMHALYQHAVDNSYRFFSYGDASLLWKVDPS